MHSQAFCGQWLFIIIIVTVTIVVTVASIMTSTITEVPSCCHPAWALIPTHWGLAPLAPVSPIAGRFQRVQDALRAQPDKLWGETKPLPLSTSITSFL